MRWPVVAYRVGKSEHTQEEFLTKNVNLNTIFKWQHEGAKDLNNIGKIAAMGAQGQ